MLNLERALNQDRLLRALTGLNRKAFDALLPDFEQAYEASRIAAKPVRKRARGGGHKARLQRIEAKLFYILFYFKCYPTFDLAGILFDIASTIQLNAVGASLNSIGMMHNSSMYKRCWLGQKV
jgi:hypothetical protein